MINYDAMLLKDRTVISVIGTEAQKFLQNLLTNDLSIDNNSIIYSALLTPQGKYLFDFFVLKETANSFFVDVALGRSEALIRSLMRYRLRSDVRIEKTDLHVFFGRGEKPIHSYIDPRHEKMGWRFYSKDSLRLKDSVSVNMFLYDKMRVKLCVPETGIELLPEQTFILEAGFERLSGVSFTKGCFVGQEVTARMRHKTQLKKGLVVIEFGSSSNLKTHDNLYFKEKVVGKIYTKIENRAIAYLNFRYEQEALTCGDTKITKILKF